MEKLLDYSGIGVSDGDKLERDSLDLLHCGSKLLAAINHLFSSLHENKRRKRFCTRENFPLLMI